MAEYPTLANLLAGPSTREEYIERYGIDPQAPFMERTGQALGQFAKQAPLALMGFRAPSAQASMRPFNPNAPKAPLPKAPEGEAVAQGLYEAMLGRPPGGAPGSGHWYPFGIPVAKSPIPHAIAAGAGYGIWNVLGGPEAWHDLKAMHTQGTPEYEAEQRRKTAVLDDMRRRRESEAQSREELVGYYGPEAMEFGIPYGAEGMRRWARQPHNDVIRGRQGHQNNLPYANGIPFPPDPNKP